MLRTLGVLAVAGLGILAVALGGQIGPVNLMDIPLPMLGFAAATVAVLVGLHYI